MTRNILGGVGAALTAAAVLAAGPAHAVAPQRPSASASHESKSHATDAHARHADKAAVKAAKAAGAILDTGTRGNGDGLVGAVPDSYPVYSSTYDMGLFGDSPKVLATCADGFFVDYTAISWGDTPLYALNVAVHSSSVFVEAAEDYPEPWNQVATDSGGHPQYQGFYMRLSNNNAFASNSGSFSWTCNPVL